MENKYGWLLKRYDRSVQNLRLWDANPRLDPSDSYLHVKDFINGMLIKDIDRTNFIDLAQSIVERGFIPADPIVVWQDGTNSKYYVAEGNRRVAVLKLLLDPTKAPKTIKRSIELLSLKIDHTTIEKIPVAVAPSFDDCIWYINQRHETSSNQKKWIRENYLIWISGLYKRFNKDISAIKEYTGATESDLNNALCVLKLKNKFKDFGSRLTDEENEEVMSKRFPISTLERIVTKDFVQKKFGFYFDGSNIGFCTEYEDFLDAFSVLIRRLVLPKENPERLDSRTLNTNEDIKNALIDFPDVRLTNERKTEIDNEELFPAGGKPIKNNKEKIKEAPVAANINDPNRKYVVPTVYQLTSPDYRLKAIFNELKKLSLNSYPNIASATIRIFLDIAIRNFILSQNLETAISKQYQMGLKDIQLSRRLEFIKGVVSSRETKKIITILLDPENVYSLDTLNGYIHSSKTYAINRQLVNGFWDFLLPMFQELLDIKEEEN